MASFERSVSKPERFKFGPAAAPPGARVVATCNAAATGRLPTPPNATSIPFGDPVKVRTAIILNRNVEDSVAIIDAR